MQSGHHVLLFKLHVCVLPISQRKRLMLEGQLQFLVFVDYVEHKFLHVGVIF